MKNVEFEHEETLDPKDWAAFRELAHRVTDDIVTYLETVRDRPVRTPIPENLHDRFRRPLPTEPTDAESVYEEFTRDVLPHPTGNLHPRFWGWVQGTGTPFGVLADMLASAMNCNLLGGAQVPVLVENQVLDWCKEMLGFPAEASGVLVGGGSTANLVGLTVARNARAEFDVAKHGLSAAPRRMVLYGSTETHNSVQKAVETLGLGSESLRKIPVDAEYRIDIAALEKAIAEDRANGLHPFCVVGNAGTVNTGASDDLDRLADICRNENLWFHVDGAFGAWAALSPGLRPQVAGMERADSLAFDLHKWMYMPYQVACTLVRHAGPHREAYSVAASYLGSQSKGFAASPTWFSELGPELSRSFRALKVWMLLKEHGIDAFRRLVEQNVVQAAYLAERIAAHPELDLVAPAPLNVVCFRYKGRLADEERINALNRNLLGELQDGGVALVSHTVLGGRFALRAAITNHRSRREDFDVLVEEVLRLGRRIEQGESETVRSRPTCPTPERGA